MVMQMLLAQWCRVVTSSRLVIRALCYNVSDVFHLDFNGLSCAAMCNLCSCWAGCVMRTLWGYEVSPGDKLRARRTIEMAVDPLC